MANDLCFGFHDGNKLAYKYSRNHQDIFIIQAVLPYDEFIIAQTLYDE